MDLPCHWNTPRPFVHPLTTPAGAILSIDAPDDHPWHHGLWFAIKFVNRENFWEEFGEFGTLLTTSVTALHDGVEATIDWVAPDGESVRVREARRLTTVPIDVDAYAIDWTEELTVPIDTVLDRAPFTTWGGYGGLTLRGAPSWTDTVIRLDDGVPRDRVRGERSAWLAIDGYVIPSEDLELTAPPAETPSRSAAEASSSVASRPISRKTYPSVRAEVKAGLVMLDHPSNPRAPSPWYASTRADTYGDGWANFVNAAFLWDEPLALTGGETLTLRYRVVVHDAEWDLDRIRTEQRQWTT